jgi:sporulation protein YunB
MRKMKKLKIKRSIKINYVIWIVLFLIFINTLLLLNLFNKNVNPKLEKVVEMDIDKMINNIITEYSLKEDYDTIKNILIINKNNAGEIIDIDFDLSSLYNFSSHITDELKNDLSNLEVGKTSMDYYDENLSINKDYFVLMVPYGIASDNIYFSNLGPKIPVKVKFIGSILTGVKTKVTDYGINNSLIEVYTTIDISTLVITPVSSKRNSRNFEILVASKIIEGKIPEIYGGIMEKNSSISKTTIN